MDDLIARSLSDQRPAAALDVQGGPTSSTGKGKRRDSEEGIGPVLDAPQHAPTLWKRRRPLRQEKHHLRRPTEARYKRANDGDNDDFTPGSVRSQQHILTPPPDSLFSPFDILVCDRHWSEHSKIHILALLVQRFFRETHVPVYHHSGDDIILPEKGTTAANAPKPTLSVSTFTRRQKSSENVQKEASLFSKSPLSASDPKATVGMTAVPLRHPHQSGRPPGTAQSNVNFGQSNGSLGPPAPVLPSANSPNPYATFQHIHDMASKRIATLDYLRKVSVELLLSTTRRPHLLPQHPPPPPLNPQHPPLLHPRKLAKRATHYLHLGFSLPTVLDLNSSSATEYLRALNALLLEYETYQSIHGADGGSAGSLSRGKVAGMFKRATHAAASTKARRTSSAADAFHPPGGGEADPSRPSTSLGGNSAGPSSTTASFASALPSGENDLLPGEEYTFLLTPSLPFEPDFFETFATLCDVLIDCYTRILQLLPTPEALAEEGRRAGGGGASAGGGGSVGDLFAKADARIRKTIVAGIVREFEGASREGIKVEVASVGKVVLGGWYE
ncbi:hypothetical protein H2199_004864 [Coniosporium tulheliwenetii]|uniref:Uncharacterized protein n=1 Tax=Coniosporium tulheliwenetii TaxID=3383036 RepID=A0ACC2Z4A3_9PEZI|nr:hypothetical protein H2199_004864 [Cladosporium sp. JES 115]